MTYNILFKVRIHHNYYTKGYAKDFSIRPTIQTKSFLKKYRMLFVEMENGFDVLAPIKSPSTPLLDIGASTKMSFALYLSDSAFLNYTELKTRTAFNQLYYLDNLSLHGAPELTVKDWEVLTVKPCVFSYNIESDATEVILKIIDPFNKTLYDSSLQKSERLFNYPVDIGDRPQGHYTFETVIDGIKQETEFFYLSDDLNRDRPIAVLDFFSSELSYSTTSSYTVHFQSRKAPWVYHIILKKDYVGNTISIRDTKDVPTVAFKKITGPHLTKGTTLTFQSVKTVNENILEEIFFHESPISDFDLVIRKNDNGDETEIKGLPNPSIHSLKQEMYITI